jgi:hypothetical protein
MKRLGAGAGRGNIPTVLKGLVKIPLMSVKRNIDAGLRCILLVEIKLAWDNFR